MPIPASFDWTSGRPVRLEFVLGGAGHRADAVDISDIESALDQLGAAPIRDEVRARRPCRRARPEPEPLAPDRAVALMQEFSQETRTLIQRGWSRKSRFKSAQAADMSVLHHLIEAGLTDGEIASVFDQCPEGVGRHEREIDDPTYLAWSIDKARLTAKPWETRPSTVRIQGVKPARTSGRVDLHVDVIEGPHEGESLTLGLSLSSKAVPFVFDAAGIPRPAVATLAATQDLTRRTASVTLRTLLCDSVEAHRWHAARPTTHGVTVPISASVPTTVEVAPPSPPPEWKSLFDAELARITSRGIPVDLIAWDEAVRGERSALFAQMLASSEGDHGHVIDALESMAHYADEIAYQAATSPDGRVRSTWDAASTWAGRIVSRRPPLQIVKKGPLRLAVVAPPGRIFLDADWSQAQPRVLAGLSKDPALLNALADENRDLYREFGEAAMPGEPKARSLGKVLLLPLFFLAGEDTLRTEAVDADFVITIEQARAVQARFVQAFPGLCKWRDAQRKTTSYRTPLGRYIALPKDEYMWYLPKLTEIIAGIAQAHESDALRLVVAHAAERLAGTGAEIILLMHDGLVIEVPEHHADQAKVQLERLMLEALAFVSGSCPPKVQIEVRRTWGT